MPSSNAGTHVCDVGGRSGPIGVPSRAIASGAALQAIQLCLSPRDGESETAMPAERQRQRHDADADLVRAGALGAARSDDPPGVRHHGAGRVADRREVPGVQKKSTSRTSSGQVERVGPPPRPTTRRKSRILPERRGGRPTSRTSRRVEYAASA